MNNIIELELLAVDFKGTEFIDSDGCAIEKACKRQLNVEHVCEYCDHVWIDGCEEFNHDFYSSDIFNADTELAQSHNFDNTVIRTLTLTKI